MAMVVITTGYLNYLSFNCDLIPAIPAIAMASMGVSSSGSNGGGFGTSLGASKRQHGNIAQWFRQCRFSCHKNMVPIQNKSGTPKKTMATFGDASHLGWRATGRCRSRQVGRSRLERPFKAWHIGIQLQSSWNSPAYDIELDCSKHWWCRRKNYLNVLSDSASWKSVGQSLGSVKFSAARSGCTTITNRNGEIARKKSCFGWEQKQGTGHP